MRTQSFSDEGRPASAATALVSTALENRIGLITSFCFTYDLLYSLTTVDSSALRREFYTAGNRLGVGPRDPGMLQTVYIRESFT